MNVAVQIALTFCIVHDKVVVGGLGDPDTLVTLRLGIV